MCPEPLTDQQEAFRRWLIRFQRKHGYSPTYDEIMRGFGCKSKAHVYHFIRHLEEKGHLRRKPGSARAIELLNERFAVRLCGKVAAGHPINFADDTGDTIEITADLVPPCGDLYAVQVAGDSMIDALIRDGDLLLVVKTPHVENGQLAIVRVPSPIFPEGETTCKRFFRSGNLVELRPENKAYSSTYFPQQDVVIDGKVVGVIRSELWGSLAAAA